MAEAAVGRCLIVLLRILTTRHASMSKSQSYGLDWTETGYEGLAASDLMFGMHRTARSWTLISRSRTMSDYESTSYDVERRL